MRLTLDRPCPMKLGEFPQKQGHRWHCGQCDKHVYDLSEMGPERAAKLIRERAHDEEVCAQWVEDRHGNVMFNVAWAAAAAAITALATPAFADGGDALFDAIDVLNAQHNADNQRADSLAGVPQGTITTADEPPPRPMAGGISRYIPPPPPKP